MLQALGDLYLAAIFQHFRHPGEGRDPWRRKNELDALSPVAQWVPAFAGMTEDSIVFQFDDQRTEDMQHE